MIEDRYASGRPGLTAPPSVAGAMPTMPSTWPMVIGVVMIVLASMGMLAYGCGAVINTVWPLTMSKLAQSQAGQDPAITAQLDLSRRFMAWNVSNAIVSAGLSFTLLMAGVAVVRRRPWCARLSVVWAIARVLWAIPASYVGYCIAIESFQAMEKASADAGRPMPNGFGVIMHSLGAVGVAISLVVACALPAFVLIWFSRSKIKNEIAQWRSAWNNPQRDSR